MMGYTVVHQSVFIMTTFTSDTLTSFFQYFYLNAGLSPVMEHHYMNVLLWYARYVYLCTVFTTVSSKQATGALSQSIIPGSNWRRQSRADDIPVTEPDPSCLLLLGV